MSQEALIWLNGPSECRRWVKPTTWRILECLALQHDVEKGCCISQAALAKRANVSRGTINNHLDILEREGLIARERRGSPARGVMQTTRYHFPFESSFDRFKRPPSVLGAQSQAARGARATGGAAFVPPTVQELDNSFRTHTERKEFFHPNQIVVHCVDACGPGLCAESRRKITATNHVVIAWLETGYSLEKDVLPTLRKRTSRVRGQTVWTWDYFSKAIAEANHRRLEREKRKVASGAPRCRCGDD